MLPPVEASIRAKCVIVPQFPVACGNVQAALFDAAPLDGAANVTAWRAYEPPVTSVPEPSSEVAVVNRATYTAAGGT